MLQTKRGKGTYPDQTDHLSRKLVPVPRRQRAVTVRRGMCGLDDRSARRRLDKRPRTITVVCVVTGVEALPLGPLGMDMASNLDLLLLYDGGAVGGPTVDDDGSVFFTGADAGLLG